MATFPRTEAEVAALAQAMIVGLTDNVAIYPSPPVNLAGLALLRSTYLTAKGAAMAASAAAEQATADKDDTLEALADGMRMDLRYAENTVDFDDDKLKLIGWAGRRSPTALQAPGQPRVLEAPRQGPDWVFLDWKAPIDGGKPAAYKVSRRERPAGPWEDVATAIETEATLFDQPAGKELEYRIVPVNRVGSGQPSNIAMAVL